MKAHIPEVLPRLCAARIDLEGVQVGPLHLYNSLKTSALPRVCWSALNNMMRCIFAGNHNSLGTTECNEDFIWCPEFEPVIFLSGKPAAKRARIAA